VSALAVAGAVYAQGGGGRGGRGHSGGHHSGGIGGRGTQPNYNYNYQDGCLFGDYGAPGTGLNPNMPNFFNFNNECALGEDCTAPGWNRQGGTWGGMMGGFGGQGSMMGVQGGVAVYGELEQEQIDALTLGLQDEINAYAFYGAVIEQFGPVYPFTQIQRSESMHAAALQAAFERYGLEVPEIIPADPPAFASAAEACAIAAQTESDNMALYDANLAAVQAYPDLVQVFTNLRNASEFMHLPAFQRCAG
jgi:hypothetical protein